MQAKSKPVSPSLYTPLPIPFESWTDISMYILLGLPRSKKGRNKVFFIIINRLSKMGHFIICHKTDDATLIRLVDCIESRGPLILYEMLSFYILLYTHKLIDKLNLLIGL